tara:strand:- start:63 stop:713 length:651 start_codon:yes stop_codon:yes gene_type:complete
MKLLILDYGSGNLKSVYNSIKYVLNDSNLGYEVLVSNKILNIKKSDYIILPGVGSFQNCMLNLSVRPELIDHLKDHALSKKKPFLGICVGMQLIANYGLENGKTLGLGWIKGKVKHLNFNGICKRNNLKIPHMGWNSLNINCKSKILSNINFNDQFYFVHSYFFDIDSDKNVIAYSKYGINFPSIIYKENIIGLQFHPEKSGNSGQKVLTNWLTKY